MCELWIFKHKLALLKHLSNFLKSSKISESSTNLIKITKILLIKIVLINVQHLNCKPNGVSDLQFLF